MAKARSSAALSILEWTPAYERWLGVQVPDLVAADLRKKHDDMAESPFVFLRATYYAWAKAWPATSREVGDAPRVTCVGDLHLENFGTWRDGEGRLAWGINDFDEASDLPYTNDLVRLATSVALAHDDSRIRTPPRDLSRAFLDGYRQCLKREGQAIVFGQEHRRLEEHILLDLIQHKKKRKGSKPKASAGPPPVDCRKALEAALPAGPEKVEIRPRVAGVGSLGRPRFLATMDWNGGPVMREAKARVASAAVWASGADAEGAPAFERLLASSVRSRDPFLHLSGRWVVRRLAADTDKIEIDVKSLPRSLEVQLAALMGREVANVHLATPGARDAILEDLEQRRRGWLLDAANEMAALGEQSYKAWKKSLSS
jgi:Uncharacterized protein conserved in bacteria (DUF2252)